MVRELTVTRTIFVDSCLTGAGGVNEKAYYSFEYPPTLQTCNLSISSLEAFNILVATRMWATEMQSQQVMLFCDNSAAVAGVQSGTARDPLIRGVAREVWLLCALHDIDMEVRHRPGALMQEPDLLSRRHLSADFQRRYRKFQEQAGYPPDIVRVGYMLPPVAI